MWETKDFRAWLTKQPQNLQYPVQNIIGSNKDSEVIVVVLSPDRYREWLELYTNESTRIMVAESSIVVPRSFLPIEVTRHLSASEVQYGYTSSDEAVIVTLSGDEWVKCPYCQILVSALIGWALGRFVFDPLWNAMEAEWRKHFTSKDCPHSWSLTAETYERCASCNYGHLSLLSNWGYSIEVRCDACGDRDIRWNPLY